MPVALPYLQALHDLRCAVLAQRGSFPEAVLPPPLQRALLRGEAVAGALRLLLQVRGMGPHASWHHADA